MKEQLVIKPWLDSMFIVNKAYVWNFLVSYVPFIIWMTLCAAQVVYVYYGLINKRTRWDWTEVETRRRLALILYFAFPFCAIGPGLLLFLNTDLLFVIWRPVAEYWALCNNWARFGLANSLFFSFTSSMRIFQMHYFSTWGVRLPKGAKGPADLWNDRVLRPRYMEEFFYLLSGHNQNQTPSVRALTKDGRRCVLVYRTSYWVFEFVMLLLFHAALLFYLLRAYKVIGPLWFSAREREEETVRYREMLRKKKMEEQEAIEKMWREAGPFYKRAWNDVRGLSGQDWAVIVLSVLMIIIHNL